MSAVLLPLFTHTVAATCCGIRNATAVIANAVTTAAIANRVIFISKIMVRVSIDLCKSEKKGIEILLCSAYYAEAPDIIAYPKGNNRGANEQSIA
jgi:hypothetical protein